MLYRLLRGIGKLILFLLFRVEIKGEEIVPRKGPLIIAINHISPMDPSVLGIIFPGIIHFFVAEDLFEIPLVGWVIKRLGVIPVDRREKDFRSLKRAIALLKKGEIIAIFPQGGIPPPESPKRYEIKPGVAYLAIKTGAPVLCVCIRGTDKVIPRGNRFFKRIFTEIYLEYRAIIYPSVSVEDVLKKIEKEIFGCEDTYRGR